MLKQNASATYKKDLKRCAKRGYDLSKLNEVVDTLLIPAPLDEKHKDHLLSGDHVGHRECHITPDWLLEYIIDDEELYLIRTGTHSDIFG